MNHKLTQNEDIVFFANNDELGTSNPSIFSNLTCKALWCSGKASGSQPDMLGDLTHVVRLNWQDWAGHSSYVVK